MAILVLIRTSNFYCRFSIEFIILIWKRKKRKGNPYGNLCDHMKLQRSWGRKRKHEDLFEYTVKLTDTMRKRSLKFCGNLMRMDNDRLTKGIFDYIVGLETTTEWVEKAKKGRRRSWNHNRFGAIRKGVQQSNRQLPKVPEEGATE